MILKKIILAKQLVVTKDEDAGLEAVFQCVRGKKTVSSETEWMDENNTLFSNYVYIFQLIIRTHYFLIGQTRTNIYLSKLDIQISMWYNHRCSIWVTCSSCCHLNSDQALVIFEGDCPWLYKQCPSFEGTGRVFLFVFFQTCKLVTVLNVSNKRGNTAGYPALNPIFLSLPAHHCQQDHIQEFFALIRDCGGASVSEEQQRVSTQLCFTQWTVVEKPSGLSRSAQQL